MPQPLVLTFDMGTQSARAMLVDAKGNIVDKVQKKYEEPYYSANPGWAEQKADFYWQSICEVSRELKARRADDWEQIFAVTLTCIRDTGICVDSSGTPLRDAIVWLDKREADFSHKPLPPLQRMLFSAAGKLETVELQRKVSVCNWIMQNEPEIWANTYKFLMLPTYLNFRLCGKIIDSTANMIGHIPFNAKTHRWMKHGELTRCVFDIEPEKLCELKEPGELLGEITAEAAEATGIKAGLPLIATGSDKGCETLGLSCITPDKAAVSFGTTATVQFTTEKYLEPLPFIPPYSAVLKDRYNPEFQVYRGYWLISWFKHEFAEKEERQAAALGVSAEELLNQRLREISPGCDGLIMQPYFTPGVIMPHAKGSIIGFYDIHTRLHIYRAIIEGINFALMDGMRTIEKRGRFTVKELYLAGGGAQSREICQITANMFGLPVCRIQTHEASGLGSSIVAFVSKGIYASYEEAIENMVHVKDVFVPDGDEHKIYEDLFDEIYSKIYRKLVSLYRKSYMMKNEENRHES